MSNTDWESLLNDRQYEAVSTTDGPVLVLAGAGSGKTRALTYRVAYLIEELGVAPWHIMAITFTNKAAGEMRDRINSLVEGDADDIWVATFHSSCVRILRRYGDRVGYERGFSIYDADDQKTVMKAIINQMNIDTKKYKERTFLNAISHAKDELIGPDKYAAEAGHDPFQQLVARVYKAYQERLLSNNALDFDDLILKTVELLQTDAEAREYYQRKLEYVMVDEYQDIDGDQAEFIYALAQHGNLVAVGDDDQTIYEFRGGTNKYMLEFKEHFPNAETVVLDRNFRSTGALVKAGQELIKTNKVRIQKKVGSARQAGVAPVVIEGQTPADISALVEDVVKAGYHYSDVAVTSWKNPTLETLSKAVPFPNVLGKAMLTDSAIFHIALDILSMSYKDMDDKHMAHYLTVMGMDGLSDVIPCGNGIVNGLNAAGYFDESGKVDKAKADEGPAEALIVDALSLLSRLNGYIKDGCAAFFFLDTLLSHFEMEDTSVAEALEQVIETRKIKTTDRLFEVLQYMADFGDDTRLEPERGDTVLFLTSHESKGMEFPVVIMVDDYSDDGKEGTKRLYYVAMTRAKDRLYIAKKRGKETLFDLVAQQKAS